MLNKWIKRKTLLIALLLLAVGTINAQTQVEGKVAEEDGTEIIGATVIVKGKPASGVVTDIDGKYKINVADASKDILVFTYMGMEQREVKIDGRKIVDVTMKTNSVLLDEVVAIGYGTMKRSDISGSVSSVKGKEIGKMPITSVSQALAGKVAGVQVIQSQGSPDADISIRVRGGMSITQSNEPLYIIDGFQSESGLLGIDPSDIESIDVLKDASATAIYGSAGANGVILVTTKTAKEGKPQITFDMYVGFKKLTKRMDLLSSEQFVKLEYERAMVLGSDDEKRNYLKRYADPYSESSGFTVLETLQSAYGEIHDVYGNRPGVNWQDEVFDDNSPLSQSYKIGISGGTKTSSYNVSYAYNNDDGIMKRSGLTRNSIRGKFTQQLTSKMRLTANVAYTDETTNGMGSLNDAGQFSRMQHIIQYRPIYEKYKNDRDLLNFQKDPITEDDSGNQMQNPLISIEAEQRERRNKILSLNGELSYSILKNLRYRGTIGLRTRTTDNDLFYAAESRQAINTGSPYGRRDEYEYKTTQFNNTLTWNTKLNKVHKLDVMVGQEYLTEDYRYRTHTYSGFPDDNHGLDDLGMSTTMGIPSNLREPYKKLSFFTRANYNYNEKYLATFTLRADASSRFHSDNRWGYFPALSLAWRAAEEDFIKNLNTFSDLKVRFSYGTAGNDKVGPYRSLAKMGSSSVPFANGMSTAYAATQMPNPDIKWETNTTGNLGLDFGFFDQRIQASVDVYKNETKDLLLNSKIPWFMGGFGSVMKNIGQTENKGIEVSINTVNITTRDFSWTTSLNFAHNKNKVKKLAGVDYFTTRSGWAQTSEFNEDDYITQVGQTVGLMYGYKLEGLYSVDDFDYVEYSPGKYGYKLKDNVAYIPSNYDPTKLADNNLQPGSWKFADLDQSEGEKGVINAKDKTVIGDATPDLYGGMINNFTYKWFDLSVGLTFRLGGDVFNANKMYFTKMNNRYRNSLEQSADRFTYIDENGVNVFNDPTNLKRINEGKTMASVKGSTNLVFHSGYVEDGSYLRLDNLTFGVTLPKKIVQKMYVSNLRVYFSSYNLFTITGYDGFDPDVNVKSNNGLSPNVDWGAYPRSLSFVFGLNLTL